jgi:mRNA-degrading endonuclease RelE of RelBE toxin-antitoxin system
MVMSGKVSFTLQYARAVVKHLKSIEAKYHGLIRERIQEQLTFEPNIETKNRKSLRQPAPFDAEWEIRFGPDNRFRVLYEIDSENHAVQILAIGEKSGNELLIAGERVKL